MMKSLLSVLFGALAALAAPAAELKINSFSSEGRLTVANSFPEGIGTIERADSLPPEWRPVKNFFITNRTATTTWDAPAEAAFFRVKAVDISPGPKGFANLAQSWSTLATIAGRGHERRDNINSWEPEFEGGGAIEAELSRPHFAMADLAGNVYIADKNAHAIRKVTPDGAIFTVAGTNEPGDGGDYWELATANPLDAPNGLWVRGDGTFYILDSGNRKIRRVDTQGEMATLVHTQISPHRGLWVSDDESEIYFGAEQQVMRWTFAGLEFIAGGFVDLGNLVKDPSGRLVVTDRGGNRVYRIHEGGEVEPIAGNGLTEGGGHGSSALETALPGVRAIWFLPTGAYFLATHEGSQVWYVDTAGVIHLFLDGALAAHSGDGEYFRTPGQKVSEIRSITLDSIGNILLTEHDAGYVRRIEFLPHTP